MNKDIIKGNWLQLKGKLRQQWGKLTDDDVARLKGSYEELSGELQKKYGYDKAKANAEIDAFLNKHHLYEDVEK